MQNEKVIGFIPARGGSKGIPGKNIKNIAGKPLITYSIDAALKSKVIDEVVVSTECEQIKEVIRNYYPSQNHLTIHNRSFKSATDEASTESVMLEYAKHNEFKSIILIQLTSPLTNAVDLSNAYSKYYKEDLGGLISVVRQKRFLWDEQGNPLNYYPKNRPRRQDFRGVLVENGAFYITDRTRLLKSGCRMSEPYGIYEMPEYTYYEIDEPEDWAIVEKLLEYHKLEPSNCKPNNSIKLFLTDVDGVLTNAGMYYSENGDELKRFNTRDGKGIEMLKKAGIKTGLITSENTKIVSDRAKKLKMDYVFQGAQNKLEIVKKLVSELGIQMDEVAYIGDDINDLEVIKSVGYSACPIDGEEIIKQYITFQCKRKGGEACVREFAGIILANFLKLEL